MYTAANTSIFEFFFPPFIQTFTKQNDSLTTYKYILA